MRLARLPFRVRVTYIRVLRDERVCGRGESQSQSQSQRPGSTSRRGAPEAKDNGCTVQASSGAVCQDACQTDTEENNPLQSRRRKGSLTDRSAHSLLCVEMPACS